MTKLGRPNKLNPLLLRIISRAGEQGATLPEIEKKLPQHFTRRALNYAAHRLIEKGQLTRGKEPNKHHEYRYWRTEKAAPAEPLEELEPATTE
jgi:hypothetical protein